MQECVCVRLCLRDDAAGGKARRTLGAQAGGYGMGMRVERDAHRWIHGAADLLRGTVDVADDWELPGSNVGDGRRQGTGARAAAGPQGIGRRRASRAGSSVLTLSITHSPSHRNHVPSQEETNTPARETRSTSLSARAEA